MNIKDKKVEKAENSNYVAKQKLSVIRIVVISASALAVLALIWLILYFTCIVDMSPSGYDIKRSGSGVEIISYSGDEEKLNIPESINGNNVVSIADKAFYNNKTVKEVVFPKTIKRVGDYAFANCSNLYSVRFDSNITYFGKGVFQNSSVKKAELPKTLQKIEDEMFKNCSKMTQVVFPDNLLGIGKEAFYGCTSLESMVVGKAVKQIGENAFGNENSSFALSGIIGSSIETYAKENNIDYIPCNRYYEKYTERYISQGENTLSAKVVSEGKRGIMVFIPEKGGYYKITLQGEDVNFYVSDDILATRYCESIKGNKNEYIDNFKAQEKYYLPVTAKMQNTYRVTLYPISKKEASLYKKAETMYNGESTYELKSNSSLKTDHYVGASTVAKVSNPITLSKVLDYYIEDNTYIWYKISANVGGNGEQELWFRTK